MRLSHDELNELKEKLGVDILWSFSRFNCYRTSQYEYMLKYIRKMKENTDKPSAYAPMGSVCHDALEKFYNKEIEYKDLATDFDDSFTVNVDIAGLCFDRSDAARNNNIKDKYYVNLMHYFRNFIPMSNKPIMEQFLTVKITDDIVFQGYSDCIVIEDGYYVIKDFKTSTIYKGAKKDKESAQLVLYAEALRQKGVPKDKIKASWLFLKYVMIDCEQVNGKIKTREVERCEIGNALQSSAKTWLKKLGYEEDMLMYLGALMQSNDIKCLPEDVQAKFKIRDCEVFVDDIWTLYDSLKEEIISVINEINKKTIEYNKLKETDLDAAEQLFWDNEDSLKAQSYYYNNLCGYNIPTIKPYKEYLDRITGKDLNINSSENKEQEEFDVNDLSWLNGLT